MEVFFFEEAQEKGSQKELVFGTLGFLQNCWFVGHSHKGFKTFLETKSGDSRPSGKVTGQQICITFITFYVLCFLAFMVRFLPLNLAGARPTEALVVQL